MEKRGFGKVWPWENRILAILTSLLGVIFSLDSFSESRPWAESLVTFIIHNIPTYLLLGILVVAWRWEWLGGFLDLARLLSCFLVRLESRPCYHAGDYRWAAFTCSLVFRQRTG